MISDRTPHKIHYDSPVEAIMLEQELAKLDVDDEEMRKRNVLASDEMFIGIRVIATNVKRAMPTFVQYLEKSHRQLALTSIGSQPVNSQRLEQWFTELVRHEGWQLDFYRQAYSGMLHGRGIINVLTDPTKPSKLVAEFVAAEDFVFPLASSLDIQECSMIARRYNVTYDDLESIKTLYSLDEAVVKELVEGGTMSTTHKKFERLFIYHVYTKINNVVHCCWWTPQLKSKKLRNWYKFSSGKLLAMINETGAISVTGQMADVTEYPFFVFVSQITSSTRLLDIKGRGFDDVAIQDAQSSILSSLVNSTHRASQFYPYTEDKIGLDFSDLKLEHNKIFKTKLGVFSPNPPPTGMLAVVQHLASQGSQDAGQLSFAASNRRDSRRTAKELELAESQDTEIDSVSTLQFGLSTLKVFSYIYDVVVTNALTDPTSIDPELYALMQVRYNKRAAGDVDFVERKDKLDRLMKFWPLVATNQSLAVAFLKDLISLAFPAEAKKYLTLIDQPQVAQVQLIQSLIGIIRQIPGGTFDPQMEQQIAQLVQQTEASYADQRPGNGAQATMGNPPSNS